MSTGKKLAQVALGLLLVLGGATDAETAAQADKSDEDTPSLRAYLIEDTTVVRLDGLLDEPAWQAAEPIGGFRQREPNEGEPATERTEVRVLYDRQYLYIGIRAFDSEPDRIVARQLERDAPLGLSRFGPAGGDDSIELILDTYHDRRNAFYFATNPRGVQVDGLITDESERPDINWDAVWDVRARITSEGWSAEIEIPLRSVRFPRHRGVQTWGFNVQRVVARKSEQDLWTAWSRDNEGLTRISRAGELTGLDSLPAGPSVQVKPYILGESGQDYIVRPDGSVDFDGNVGLDAKYAMASGLVLDLTVNTDFAQVEADDEQIDLTRFNLFFPEKREFFLENAGIFEFGAGQFFGPPPMLLFFSRRIGLEEGLTVPMIAGARLSGRSGRQTIGFLEVVTGEKEALDVPLTNFAVARIKRDVGAQSYVGAIATSRIEEGGGRNLAGGIDWNFWLTRQMVLQGFVAGVTDSRPGGDDYSWRLSLDYTGDWIGWRLDHLEIGPEMLPAIGFVRRLDMARTSAGFRLTPRPPIPGLRKIDIFNRLEYVASAETREVRDRGWGITFTPQLNSGDRARLEISYQFQRLVESFELAPDVIVPVGDYDDWNFSASVNTSRARPISGEIGGGTGGFWDGDRWFLNAALAFNSPHIGMAVGYGHNNVDVPGGAFTTDLISGRLKLALNTKLFGNALIQYNSQTGTVSANVRIDLIYRPGSDLFIVFNERRDVLGGRWDPESRAFIVKLTYLHWF